MIEKAQMRCPTCGKPTDFTVEPVGSFCSDRCKLVDLGKWLGEEYRISEPLRAEHFAEFEELGDVVDPDRPD